MQLLIKLGIIALALSVGVAGQTLAQEPGKLDGRQIPELAAPQEAVEEFEADYGHGIVIEGTPEFIRHVSEVLDELALLPTGAAILEAVGEDEHLTVIREFDQPNATVEPLNLDEASEGIRGFWGRGEGIPALMSWNPEFELYGFPRPVIMGHELLHALHFNRGELRARNRLFGPNQGTSLEELVTIGTDGYEDEELSENRLREEWNERYPDQQIPAARYGHGPHDFLRPEPWRLLGRDSVFQRLGGGQLTHEGHEDHEEERGGLTGALQGAGLDGAGGPR